MLKGDESEIEMLAVDGPAEIDQDSSFWKDYLSLLKVSAYEKKLYLSRMRFWEGRKFKALLFREKATARPLVGLMAAPMLEKNDLGLFGFLLHSSLEDLRVVMSPIQTALTEWVAQAGLKRLVGPIDGSTWFQNRMKTQGFEQGHFWEPHNEAALPALFKEHGWELDKEYVSKFFVGMGHLLEHLRPSYERALSPEFGLSFCPIDLSSQTQRHRLYELNAEGFADNYMFEPINEAIYIEQILGPLGHADLQYSFFVVDKEGREQGYVFSFAEGESIVVKSLIVSPELRSAGLSSALVYASVLAAQENGLNSVVGALVRRGNLSERFFDKLGEIRKEHVYGLLAKSY